MEKIRINDPENLKTVSVKVIEAETTISMMRDETRAHIYTSDNSMVTKMKRAWRKCTNKADWICYAIPKNAEGDVSGYTFDVPKKVVGIRSTKEAKAKRILTEEERKAIGVRMHRGISKKVNNI